MPLLEIKLVGELRVVAGRGRDVRVNSRKPQALLAFLAAAPGTRHGRDALATLLWEDSDPQLARSSLRQALAALRRTLPAQAADALQADATCVWLDTARATSDLARFYASLRAGDLAAAAAVFAVDAGELLANLDARSVGFEQWLTEQRRSLRRQRIDVHERLAARAEASSDWATQRAALETLLQLDPTNERAHRALMGVYAREGRYTDALRQYRACRDTLRRELDVATEPATEALFRDILRRRRNNRVETDDESGDDADDRGKTGERATRSMAPIAATQPAALLREASVLCARRIAGADATDPEQARADLFRWVQRVRATVERFGGIADAATHGELVAVFGLNGVTGNESERVARAALEIVAMGSGNLVSRDTACGIASGQLLPQSSATTFPLSGHAVDAAIELARGAPAGEVRASNDLVQRLRPRVDASVVDGLSSVVHRLHAAATGGSTPRTFVGRRAELALLTTLLDRVAASGKGRVVVIRGEPGIGKTALIGALVEEARSRDLATHVVRVLDFGQRAIERPLPALALQLLAPTADSSVPDTSHASAVIDRAVERKYVEPEERESLAVLLGLDRSAETAGVVPNAAAEPATVVVPRLLRRAAHVPRLVVVEDVHWADAAEIQSLADVAAIVTTCPVLLVFSVRTQDDPLGAAWRARARGCPMTTLDLAPLDDDEARELAATHGDWPAAVLERCLTTAAGHPLYLEHMLQASAYGESTLPGSVRALVLARVDRLAPPLQHALQAAAVLGHRFALDAWRHLLGDPGFDAAGFDATGLLVGDGDERQFAHALIRDAVHESLLGSTRRALHRRAATWYESRDLDLRADHLAAAEDPAATVAYTRAAAEHLRTHRLERALACSARAIALAVEPPDHVEAHLTNGEVLLALGRTLDACSAFREAIDLAAENAERARAWLGLATALRVLDRYDEALGAVDHASRELPADDHRSHVRAWTLRGNLHFPRGQFDQCLEAHQRALAHAEAAGSIEDVARARGGIGDAQYQRGRMRSACEEFGRCVDLCEQHGLTGLRLAYLPMLGAAQVYLDDLGRALATCELAGSAALGSGDRRSEMLAIGVAASIELMRGNAAVSADLGTRSLALARTLGARRFEAENLVLQGLAACALGNNDRGRTYLVEAREIALATCPTYCGPWAAVALARATADEPDGSRKLLDEGEALLARGCVSHNHFEFRHHAMDLCVGWRDWDRLEHHARALELYTRHEPLPWAELTIAGHRALGACLRQSDDPSAEHDLAAAIERAGAAQFFVLQKTLQSRRDATVTTRRTSTLEA